MSSFSHGVTDARIPSTKRTPSEVSVCRPRIAKRHDGELLTRTSWADLQGSGRAAARREGDGSCVAARPPLTSWDAGDHWAIVWERLDRWLKDLRWRSRVPITHP
jgi:hypothetical protein